MAPNNRPLIIWRLTDGKAGHDSQSLGLTRALCDITECHIEHVPVSSKLDAVGDLFFKRYASGLSLPDPQLLIGAGHQTHLPLICARRIRNGRIVLLMKPSLPYSWFDLCLIPDHDKPPTKPNILRTRGPLNTIRPTLKKIPDKGILLIGGPSRHYRWDTGLIEEQVRMILNSDMNYSWILADSPRTPSDTRALLHNLAHGNTQYRPFIDSPQGWLADELATTSVIWVTQDSLSMIYEALTAGASVGTIKLPAKNKGRLDAVIKQMDKNRIITTFDSWRAGQRLHPPKIKFDESRRCARLVLDYFSLPATLVS